MAAPAAVPVAAAPAAKTAEAAALPAAPARKAEAVLVPAATPAPAVAEPAAVAVTATTAAEAAPPPAPAPASPPPASPSAAAAAPALELSPVSPPTPRHSSAPSSPTRAPRFSPSSVSLPGTPRGKTRREALLEIVLDAALIDLNSTDSPAVAAPPGPIMSSPEVAVAVAADVMAAVTFPAGTSPQAQAKASDDAPPVARSLAAALPPVAAAPPAWRAAPEYADTVAALGALTGVPAASFALGRAAASGGDSVASRAAAADAGRLREQLDALQAAERALAARAASDDATLSAWQRARTAAAVPWDGASHRGAAPATSHLSDLTPDEIASAVSCVADSGRAAAMLLQLPREVSAAALASAVLSPARSEQLLRAMHAARLGAAQRGGPPPPAPNTEVMELPPVAPPPAPAPAPTVPRSVAALPEETEGLKAALQSAESILREPSAYAQLPVLRPKAPAPAAPKQAPMPAADAAPRAAGSSLAGAVLSPKQRPRSSPTVHPAAPPSAAAPPPLALPVSARLSQLTPDEVALALRSELAVPRHAGALLLQLPPLLASAALASRVLTEGEALALLDAMHAARRGGLPNPPALQLSAPGALPPQSAASPMAPSPWTGAAAGGPDAAGRADDLSWRQVVNVSRAAAALEAAAPEAHQATPPKAVKKGGWVRAIAGASAGILGAVLLGGRPRGTPRRSAADAPERPLPPPEERDEEARPQEPQQV